MYLPIPRCVHFSSLCKRHLSPHPYKPLNPPLPLRAPWDYSRGREWRKPWGKRREENIPWGREGGRRCLSAWVLSAAVDSAEERCDIASLRSRPHPHARILRTQQILIALWKTIAPSTYIYIIEFTTNQTKGLFSLSYVKTKYFFKC